MKNLKVFILSFILLFTLGMVGAQEEMIPPEAPEKAVIEVINLDEDIQPEDLEISEPRLLPDSPFYFLKNWIRGIQDFFTFNPVKKAELRIKFANEKLMEVKKLVELKKDSETIKRAAENYQQEIERIKNQIDKIKEKAKENPQVENFLDKFIHQQTLHQKLLDRLETQVPPEAFEKIKEARERHLERFRDVMLKLEDREEKIIEKLDETLKKQKGSNFKDFKDLEVLKEIGEKMPANIKEKLEEKINERVEKFREKLEKMPEKEKENFGTYIEGISGDKLRQIEIISQIEAEEISEKLKEVIERIRGQIESGLDLTQCPIPVMQKCPKGETLIIERRTEKECLVFKCEPIIEKKEKEIPEVCPLIFDPVCGKDGKTYGNECFAKLAGIEIDYKGECKETCEIICPQLKKESPNLKPNKCDCSVLPEYIIP